MLAIPTLAWLLLPSVAVAQQPSVSMRSTQQPPHFVWAVHGGLVTPGLVGGQGSVALHLPGVPLAFGLDGATTWSPTLESLQGVQWAPSTTAGAWVGVDLAQRWRVREVSITVETMQGVATLANDPSVRARGRWRSQEVRFNAPVFERWTVLGGVRHQWVTGEDSARDQLRVGVEWYRAHHAAARVPGFGLFDTDRADSLWAEARWRVNGGGDLPRQGLVAGWTWRTSVLVLAFSGGWDSGAWVGSLALGFGGAHTLGGPAPQTSDLQ